jgi:hypothetical protein
MMFRCISKFDIEDQDNLILENIDLTPEVRQADKELQQSLGTPLIQQRSRLTITCTNDGKRRSDDEDNENLFQILYSLCPRHRASTVSGYSN